MSTMPPPPPYVQQPFEQKRGGWGCLWIILAVSGAISLLVCCGCAGMFYFGLNMGTEAIKTSLAQNPVVQEHVGELQEANFDWAAMFSGGASGGGEFLMRLKGTKGSATVKLRNTNPQQGAPAQLEGVLILPSGEEIPLTIDESPLPPETSAEGDAENATEDAPVNTGDSSEEMAEPAAE